MDQFTYSNTLLNHIKSLQVDEHIGEWEFKGETEVVFSTPGGQWPADGYLFEKLDGKYKFVIRCFPKDKASYIVMESINLGRQLYNINLSDKKAFLSTDGKTRLLESYIMTVGKCRKKLKDVEAEFKKQSVENNVISEIDDDHPDWTQVLIDILQGAINRETVKRSLQNMENNTTKKNNYRESFKNWLSQNFDDVNGTNSSYIRAIDIISIITEHNIFEIDDLAYLQNLYQDALKEQRKENGKYFFKDAPSYGKNGFYSASLKTYIQYLKSYTEVQKNNNLTMILPLNQIIYGPPGTGKTHKLLNEHYSNFEIKNKTVSQKEFEFEIINQLSWWQVFALVLLENRSSTVPDIKKHRFVDYKLQVSNTRSLSQTVWSQLSAHTIEDSVTVQYDKRSEPLVFNKSAGSVWEIVEDKKELLDDLLELSQKISEYKEVYVTSKNHKFITFHQSFSYEDFIEGIKPVLDNELSNESSEVSYAIEKGIFYECCNDAAKLAGFLSLKDCIENYSKEERSAKFNNASPYGLFIDEINRGNISQIFGELITVIEDTKRLGKDEIIVELPYSKSKFGVPPNLYIIGTMNTADRSVESLDTALRRRFDFEEMLPKAHLLSPSAMYCSLLWKYELVDWTDPEFLARETSLFDLLGVQDDWIESKKGIWDLMKEERNQNNLRYFSGFKCAGISLEKVLNIINKRVEVLLDRDHTIGHSYFINIYSEDDLRNTFKNNIIPLLQEYFYGDYEKIGMILGNGFFEESEKYDKNLFANFATQNYPDAGNLIRLKTINERFDIIKALKILLKKDKTTNE